MARSWDDPNTHTYSINQTAATIPVKGQVHEILPGETASVEVLRGDAATEVWAYAVFYGVENDVAKLSDIPTPKRILAPSFKRPVFPVIGEGYRFFAVEISNADLTPVDIVTTTVRITFSLTP
mgnify:CR=1 FL=1